MAGCQCPPSLGHCLTACCAHQLLLWTKQLGSVFCSTQACQLHLVQAGGNCLSLFKLQLPDLPSQHVAILSERFWESESWEGKWTFHAVVQQLTTVFPRMLWDLFDVVKIQQNSGMSPTHTAATCLLSLYVVSWNVMYSSCRKENGIHIYSPSLLKPHICR